jgi:hypothetical protein
MWTDDGIFHFRAGASRLAALDGFENIEQPVLVSGQIRFAWSVLFDEG